jgi:hypothetical protein
VNWAILLVLPVEPGSPGRDVLLAYHHRITLQ